tara:strand:+ start:109 stop:606 length:498 start_codon:yes stop_codon:yes gene_type:complete
MGRLFLEYVEAPCVYVCLSCRAHLSAHDSIISKAFQGRHGRAYLFGDVVNINSGPTENRLLLTGLHVVADIYCNACDERLGWKYVEAFEESQKYKEGRFILEKAKIIKEEELKRREAAETARIEAARRSSSTDESEPDRSSGDASDMQVDPNDLPPMASGHAEDD